MANRLYIFGAGASKASQVGVLEENKRAPLVNELFDEKYLSYADSVNVTRSVLRNARTTMGKQGLEAWLTKEWEAMATRPVQGQKATRRRFGSITLYIWFLMQKISETYNEHNLYREFLMNLEDVPDEFSIINFNYDTLLDQALQDIYSYDLAPDIADYINNRYVKPHGSVNWFNQRRPDDRELAGRGESQFDPNVRLNFIASNMYLDKPIPFNAIIEDPLHSDLGSPAILWSGRFQSNYAYPLVLIPLSTKLYDHFLNFSNRVIDAGKNLASEADEIYLIGYRAQDEVIKVIFENVKPGAVLHVVDRSAFETASIFNDVIKWKPGLEVGKCYNGGFEEFVEVMHEDISATSK